MAIASMILGILSGLSLLGWGVIGYYAGEMGSMMGVSGSGTLQFISVAVPIAILVGSGMVLKRPLVGGLLMLCGALVIMLFFGLNEVGGYFAVPSLIAGGLGIAVSRPGLAQS